MKCFFVFFCSLLFLNCFSQDTIQKRKTVNNIDFLLYLHDNKQFDDFDFFSKTIRIDSTLSQEEKDSLYFLIGILNYQRINYTNSGFYLSLVSKKTPLYYKSTFFSAYSKVQLNNLNAAYSQLDTIESDSINTNLYQLKLFQQAGISLLKGNTKTCDSIAAFFASDDPLLKKEQSFLVEQSIKHKAIKKKSPFIAGTLSAIVPGLGKVYTGNNGQALSAFIRVCSLAAFSVESYIKLGPKHPQFIILSGLFSCFYIGNIWGSALNVQISRNEQINEINHNVKVGMFVPIDNFFK